MHRVKSEILLPPAGIKTLHPLISHIPILAYHDIAGKSSTKGGWGALVSLLGISNIRGVGVWSVRVSSIISAREHLLLVAPQWQDIAHVSDVPGMLWEEDLGFEI